MTNKVVPMIHVPDVRTTVAWYLTIGFRLERTHEECGMMSWASLTFGDTEIMLNAGGKTSLAERRELDLYVHVDNVEALYAGMKDMEQVVVALYDAEYGMREFTIRDPNRFWITFGQPITSP
jgi:uncharacterized glyoxalase superfamily protein PhnB